MIATAAPRLDLDPRLSSDPVGLICELVDRYGERDAVDRWIRATTRLTRALVIQQPGPRP